MKKLEILNAKLTKLKNQLDLVSFERKDTSYRRSGGYFGTDTANLTGVIVVKTFARTKYLNTYVCVDFSQQELVNSLKAAQTYVNSEYERLNKISQKRRERESINDAIEFCERQIKEGTIFTNYAKMFIVGNKNIYAAHPYFGHSDYNKWCAMPNTAKHRKVAEQLNQRLIQSGLLIK
jgi:hypothetical protein